MLPGQGSQQPAMGAGLADVPEVREVFDCASQVFGEDMRALCMHSDAQRLNEPRNAQRAISTLSLAVARALMARGVMPQAVQGFSLGQIGALAVAGMLADEEMFALVDARSDMMERAAKKNPGAMSALLRADEATVQALCEQAAQGEVLVPANFNCPGQIVVSGARAAVERAEAAWAARGGRFARLAVAGAFHSPLMADAACELGAYLESVEFGQPFVPLVCNVDARPLAPQDARKHLCRHLVEPVRFEQSVRLLAAQGFDLFVETGHGGVLTGLMRRIDGALGRMCVQDAVSFEKACSLVRKEGESRDDR